MNYHVVIATERRSEPRELARDVRHHIEGQIETIVQLHSMGRDIKNIDNANLLYVGYWDGVAPNITVLKGDFSALNMAYAGWPMVDVAPELPIEVAPKE